MLGRSDQAIISIFLVSSTKGTSSFGMPAFMRWMGIRSTNHIRLSPTQTSELYFGHLWGCGDHNWYSVSAGSRRPQNRFQHFLSLYRRSVWTVSRSILCRDPADDILGCGGLFSEEGIYPSCQADDEETRRDSYFARVTFLLIITKKMTLDKL